MSGIIVRISYTSIFEYCAEQWYQAVHVKPLITDFPQRFTDGIPVQSQAQPTPSMQYKR
jgi:hypothetical protein